MNTSTQLIIDFIKQRGGDLLDRITKEANNPWRAPEHCAGNVQGIVMHALHEVSDAERAELDGMRGQGAVEWIEVARAFTKSDEAAPATQAAGVHVDNPKPLAPVLEHVRLPSERAAFVRLIASNKDSLGPDRAFIVRVVFERSSMLSPRQSLEVAIPYEARLDDLAEQLEALAARVRREASRTTW